ncbi:MAG: HAMP domain-containing sensor histidine kinase, partial [Spirochaetales bacterium]|nr:HAMP domain-containing sensor histidine kinase [Spirochaetales bacterium]
TRKLNFLASDLLDFSKGDINLNYSIIEVTSFIKGTLRSMVPSLAAKDIKVRLNCLYKGTVLIDADRFERVLVNIITNAKKAVSRGGIIEVKTWSEKRRLHLTFSDNGCGMSEETLNHLFEPFYSQYGNVSGKGGVGLGMVIIKNIVESHDGTLSVDSIVGKGTKIHITLPCTH